MKEVCHSACVTDNCEHQMRYSMFESFQIENSNLFSLMPKKRTFLKPDFSRPNCVCSLASHKSTEFTPVGHRTIFCPCENAQKLYKREQAHVKFKPLCSRILKFRVRRTTCSFVKKNSFVQTYFDFSRILSILFEMPSLGLI